MVNTGKHKIHKFKDQQLPCDIPGCGRHFKAPQGLFAHRRMVHGIGDKAIPAPVVRAEQVSAKELESDVKILKLQEEKRELEARLPAATEPADLMQQLGLGALDPEVKAAVQRRAVSLASSAEGQAQGWLDRLLGTPEGVKVALDVLRGGGRNDGGGLSILKDLGIDLKSLLEHSQAPKADSSFKVAGLSLDGCSLTPELLSSLVQFKASEDNLAYQKSKDDTFQAGMQTIIKLVADSGLLNRLGGEIGKGFFGRRGAARNGEIISQEINGASEPGQRVVTCETCGAENPMPAPAEIFPGMIINCRGKDPLGNNCPRSWMVEDSRPKQQVKKEQVKVDPPIVEETPCPGCGQLINLDNRKIGEIVKCPACSDELTVTSEILAAPAQDLSDMEKRDKQMKQFLH